MTNDEATRSPAWSLYRFVYNSVQKSQTLLLLSEGLWPLFHSFSVQSLYLSIFRRMFVCKASELENEPEPSLHITDRTGLIDKKAETSEEELGIIWRTIPEDPYRDESSDRADGQIFKAHQNYTLCIVFTAFPCFSNSLHIFLTKCVKK